MQNLPSLTQKQILSFRLQRHFLDCLPSFSPDRETRRRLILEIAGSWPILNSPPGAFENAVFSRIPSVTPEELDGLLCQDKLLLQAWAFRGAPTVFPTSDREVFLTSLIPQGKEPWIYTEGIGLALEAVHMTQDELLVLTEQAARTLDGQTVTSKASLDQLLARQILPLLPEESRPLWTLPSCYGANQTMGEAAVSFLLRPCALKGEVVFGRRAGRYPTFTSMRHWLGESKEKEAEENTACQTEADRLSQQIPSLPPAVELVRRCLRAYAPATPALMAAVLGVSPEQARRMWKQAESLLSILPVSTPLGRAFILAEDLPLLTDASRPDGHAAKCAAFLCNAEENGLLRPVFSHDPYLDCRDRALLLPDKKKQREAWRLVGNPGAVLCDGRIVGIFRTSRASSKLSVSVTLWEETTLRQRETLEAWFLCYAAFQKLRLAGVEWQT